MSVLVYSLTNISDYGLYRGKKENKKEASQETPHAEEIQKKNNSGSVEDSLTHLPEIS